MSRFDDFLPAVRCDMEAVSLRPARPDDREFILRVCRAAMAEHHRRARGWDDAQCEAAFMKYQDTSTTQIVYVGDTQAGILTVLHGPRASLISRIGLLPAFQGHGIGTALIRSLQTQNLQMKRPLRLTVYKCNPSRILYQRLGFEVVHENEIEYEMIWTPEKPFAADRPE